jgi:16S rRNA (adenine1518-N6/adenine1519-N6)-dimethyltransferase
MKNLPDKGMQHRIIPADRPKKSLGQHFLKDENIARKIAGSLRCESIRHVLEIGAGTGVLTRHFLERKDIALVALELDREMFRLLQEKFPYDRDKFLQQDALKYPFTSPAGENVAVIGNFPYNISSQLFFRILEYRDKVREVVCMVQKEVAERISTGPGSKTYGILSVLLQAYYHIEYLFTVSPEVFRPRPKVFSAVIRLTRNGVDRLDCDETLFPRVVKACFNQIRKIIRNSIRVITGDTTQDHYLLLKRPEQLDVGQFTELTRWVQSRISCDSQ